MEILKIFNSEEVRYGGKPWHGRGPYKQFYVPARLSQVSEFLAENPTRLKNKIDQKNIEKAAASLKDRVGINLLRMQQKVIFQFHAIR